MHSKAGNVVIEVSGDKVWELFQHEVGKHQVQRAPSGKMHTSIAVVGILKIFEFKNKSLRTEDLEIQTKRGTGPGGQARNKTESAVHMKHIPTGIDVTIDSRDQHQNKKKALEILTDRVNSHYYEIAQSDYSTKKSEQMADAGRSGKIRIYNFKTNIVNNLENGKKATIKEIMKGNLELII